MSSPANLSCSHGNSSPVSQAENKSPAADSSSGHQVSLLTIREAAALLRLSESTIRNAVRLGQLGAFRFGVRGGSIRISRADLDDYIAGSATAPLVTHSPTATGGQFKHLNASKLLAAWRQQGVLGGRQGSKPRIRSNGVPNKIPDLGRKEETADSC